MSLINDALRRASQSDKDRPRQASTSAGMEHVPKARSSRLSIFLIAGVLVALLLAALFFWQWWQVRNTMRDAAAAAIVAPPMTPRIVPPPVAPKPAPVVPVAPAAPAPVVVPPAAPVVAPPVAPPVAAPATLPNVANFNPSPWPVELKLGGIFFSKTNPRVIINGNNYGTGDDIQGVVVKTIEKDRVTLEWNGHSRVLLMGGE